MTTLPTREMDWHMFALGGIVLLSIAAAIPAFSAGEKYTTDTERLIGAWRLAKLEAPPDAPASPREGLIGTLIYSRNGRMSVQVMYPITASTVSNEYVERGYEASFGRYDIDEISRRVTHHVEGSITRDRLVGKALVRTYELTAEGQLILRSVDPSEKWSVTWERY